MIKVVFLTRIKAYNSTHTLVIHDVVSGVDRLVISASGKVCIGEMNPKGLLHIRVFNIGISPSSYADNLIIEENSAVGMSILGRIENTGSIRFGDASNNDLGGIHYGYSQQTTGNTNSMMFFTNSVERMRISDVGELSIYKTNTGSNTGSALCIGADNKVCQCG